MARITALGGVFIHSPNPTALAAWYRDTLGLPVEDWGGSMIRPDASSPGYSLWSSHDKATGFFNPSTREFVINFVVDDLDGFVAGLEAKGLKIIDRQQMEGMGKFAWVLDPDGTKVELWQAE